MAAAVLVIAACGGDKLTPNGYKFVNHTNAGGEKAKVGDYAFVHIYVYQDGKLVNSTREMGRTIPIMVPDFSQVKEEDKGVGKANPVADVLSFLAAGDSASVAVPIDSMMRQSPQLKDAKALQYDVVVVEIKNKAQYDEFVAKERTDAQAKLSAAQGREPEVAAQVADVVKQYKAGGLGDKVKSTASGLKYMVVSEGTGPQAEAGKAVDVQYYGVLTDGTMFDNSFSRGQAYKVPLGQGRVIRGWDEGIALFKEGTKAFLFIPSELGYGPEGNGTIPGGAELVFYVELEKVN